MDKDLPLNEDIYLLGFLLGETIREVEGEKFFNIVEKVRRLSKKGRNASDQKKDHQKLSRIIGKLDNSEMDKLVQAFSSFLNYATVAEQHHRIRRRKSYVSNSKKKVQKFSLDEAFLEALNKGISKGKIFKTIINQDVNLVLTAHPTEIKKKRLIRKNAQIERILSKLDHANQSPLKVKFLTDELKRIIVANWLSDKIKREKPSPLKEAYSGLLHIEESLWYVIPEFLREMDVKLHEYTGKRLPLHHCPIRFSSWMGGG